MIKTLYDFYCIKKANCINLPMDIVVKMQVNEVTTADAISLEILTGIDATVWMEKQEELRQAMEKANQKVYGGKK